MKYYFKIFLLSIGIGIINTILFLFSLQFQIIEHSSYIPGEAITALKILAAIIPQTIILFIVAFISKKDQLAIAITSGILIVTCFILNWDTDTAAEGRRKFNKEQIFISTEKYDYQQGISTPEGYPIKLLSRSEFTIAIEGQNTPATLLETNKVYSETWGNGDTTFKSSDAADIVLPDRLELFWYSFLENKYYTLSTKLNKTQISQYFKKGYKVDRSGNLDKISSTNYQELIVGIAPGGDVVLWISGPYNTKELEVFKADLIDEKDKDVYTIVEKDEIKKVLSDTCTCKNNIQYRQIVNNGKPIPIGIWTNKYRKKYNWKAAINSVGQTKSEMGFRFFNGERYELFNEEIAKMKYQKEVLPYYLSYKFIKNKKRYEVHLEFDEDEIFSHFEKLAPNNSNELIDIVLNINSNLNQVTIQLHSKDRTLNFEKMKSVEIYAD
ncbi:DUF2931 family protein [Flavobacterium reichenbachii]|uniref:DUF2931 domain-containing protein n=1 Tax=Flavobacterium reichenbachii TaxID=362418 RepID=A0A085ZMU8_9FLAO|nr:DUF2931 family protein [Flavobacterium reichenbachii]KFF05762.1 hypothetical protein IW19_09625 [Flavobacterium reichenbachii]OXB12651.1 hypothetical protein B0A68_17835 [Flavobacterium reichenbachii]